MNAAPRRAVWRARGRGAAVLLALALAPGVAASASPAPLHAPGIVRVVVDLGGPWRWRSGEGKDGDGPAAMDLDDTGWKTFVPPGHLVTPKTDAVVWLRRTFTVRAPSGMLALRLGAFAGAADVYLDGDRLLTPPASGLVFQAGLVLADGEHVLAVRVSVAKGKDGLWWNGAAPALGVVGDRTTGFFPMDWGFAVAHDDAAHRSPYALWLPAGFAPDAAHPAPLIVALHGWGGSIRSFLPYGLGAEADRTGAVVLFVEGGKSLYIASHEDAILRAIDEVAAALPIDPDRIGLLGVSMGGAGVLGVGFHYPDRFAGIVSYFGDSLYDMKTYVKGTLKTEEMAARYSVLHVPENARHVPVFLVHGRADKVCPFYHSEMLNAALAKAGCPVKLEAPAADGHTVTLVMREAPAAFDFLLGLRRVHAPARVTYGKNHDAYPGAYWVRFALARDGTFGYADVEADAPARTITVHRAEGVKELSLRLAAAPPAAWTRITVHAAAPLALRVEGPGAAAWAKAGARADGADAAVFAVPAGDRVYALP